MIRFEIHSRKGVIQVQDYARFWLRHGHTIAARLEQWKLMDRAYTGKDNIDERGKMKMEMADSIAETIHNNLMPTLPNDAQLVMVVQSKANTEEKQ